MAESFIERRGVIGFPHMTGDWVVVTLRSGSDVTGQLTDIGFGGSTIYSLTVAGKTIPWGNVDYVEEGWDPNG